MRQIIAAIFLTLLAIGASAADTEADSVKKAQESAQAWLASADAGQYGATWDQAAAPFQQSVKKAEWEQGFGSLRAPLGKLEKRTLISASYTKELPNAPAGEYVVLQFRSQFANKGEAIELITPMLEKDGSWRVSGYFIK